MGKYEGLSLRPTDAPRSWQTVSGRQTLRLFLANRSNWPEHSSQETSPKTSVRREYAQVTRLDGIKRTFVGRKAEKQQGCDRAEYMLKDPTRN